MHVYISNIAPSIVSVAYASLASYSPITGIQYSVGIPVSTTNAGSGDIYIQISASTTYEWVAMGIGQGMAGATIFLMYADGEGNVTISPRTGVGHVMPLFNSAAQVTLLAGSGVSNGIMTANVKYTAAAGLLSLSSTSSGWIGSYKSGSPLNSKDPAAFITQHDNYALYTLNLAKAQLPDDSNPFLSASINTTSSVNSGSAVAFIDPITTYEMAHGSIMAATMVVLFPLGAIILRVFGGVWLHAAIQLFNLAAIIVGFGLGIHLAMISDLVSCLYSTLLSLMKNQSADQMGQLFNCTHTIFGTVIICLFFIQPLLGFLHHRQYLKLGRRSYFGISHIWYGRILIICAVINGGLGLQLAADTTNGEIAYGVVAGVMFVLYVVVMAVVGLRKRKAAKSEAQTFSS